MSGISRDEWLEALGKAAAPCDPNALTMREIATRFGINEMAALRRVWALEAQGRVIRTHKIVNGRRRPAYRLVQATKKGKRAA